MYSIFHNVSQIVIFSGAAITATLVNIPSVSKIFPTIISSIVVLTTALVNFYNFGEESRRCKKVFDAMGREYTFMRYFRDGYENLNQEEALNTFVVNIEKLLEQYNESSPSQESKRNSHNKKE